MKIQTQDLLRMRWRLGARGPVWIDCLGISMLILARMGKPIQDPWPQLLARWQAGEDPSGVLDEGPGDGWLRIDPRESLVDGDLWILNGAPFGAGVAYAGRIWTATMEANVVNRAPQHCRPVGAWRQ